MGCTHDRMSAVQQVLLPWPCASVTRVLIKVKCVVSCVQVSHLEEVCGETSKSTAMSLSVQISTSVYVIPCCVEVESASIRLGDIFALDFQTWVGSSCMVVFTLCSLS